jgi:orotate phosphoribosyltransferase
MTKGLELSDLSACDAHRTGHFRLSSGLHSSDYLQCALYLAQPKRAAHAGRLLADAVASEIGGVELVVSPALGGLIIGHETARALQRPMLFTERSDGVMSLRRGFAIAPGTNVAVVEDVVTTGGSVKEVIELITALDVNVLGVGSIVNRSGMANPFHPLLFVSLLDVDFPTWNPDECPMCSEGLAIEKPGSRPIR